jgi:hypothetical protein
MGLLLALRHMAISVTLLLTQQRVHAKRPCTGTRHAEPGHARQQTAAQEAAGASSGAHPARSGRPRSSRCPRPAGRCPSPGRTGRCGPAACTPARPRSPASQFAVTALQAGRSDAPARLAAVRGVLVHTCCLALLTRARVRRRAARQNHAARMIAGTRWPGAAAPDLCVQKVDAGQGSQHKQHGSLQPSSSCQNHRTDSSSPLPLHARAPSSRGPAPYSAHHAGPLIDALAGLRPALARPRLQHPEAVVVLLRLDAAGVVRACRQHNLH